MMAFELTMDQGVIYGEIQQLCVIGAPFPTPDKMADLTGLDMPRILPLLEALRNKGVITVERVGKAQRIITDVATGKRTADFEPQRQSPDDVSRFASLGNGLPCWRCGAHPSNICEKRDCGNRSGEAAPFGMAADRVLRRG